MIRVWWLAARPGSLIKVVLPVAIGLAVGAAGTGSLEPVLIAAGLLFALFAQLMIIFMNDYADADADRLHTRLFPQLIDPRVVPLGLLDRQDLLKAGLLVIGLQITLCLALAAAFERPLAPVFGVASVFFMWAYSFPPIRLNYRGRGELLETLTIGGGLVWFGFYLYTGDLALPLLAVGPVLLLALASSLISTLKHQPADRVTGKRTLSVLLGGERARVIALAATVGSVLLCTGYILGGIYHPASALLTVVLPALFVAAALREFKTADPDHLTSLASFKGSLHRAIYVSNLGIIVGLIFGTPLLSW
ncbi:prenyltransferase [Thioalkalicoccus limnaeus]|uniref:Prenyltransferase n=1 Tax=Thioalkalicoccus limnaeus TaxID=120681 RepID=A0ABV4BAK3_9GAMM